MEAYIGTIITWPASFVPVNWALCAGQSLSVSENAALYSLIGNIYGGDTTNFNLPNFSNRFVIGNPTGATPGVTGGPQVPSYPPLPDELPFETTTGLTLTAPALTVNTMPAHTHTANIQGGPGSPTSVPIKIPVNSTGSANLTNPGGNVLGVSNDGSGSGNINLYNSSPTGGASLASFNASFNVSGINGSVTNSATGSAAPTALTAQTKPFLINAPTMPYLAMAYIICVQGIYPEFS